MHVLLIGSGGREHALANLIVASPRLGRLSVAPANAAMAERRVDIDVDDHRSVLDWCRRESVDLVVVGPEAPLVAGLGDALTKGGIACFGPSAAAARLEGSKSFTRAFAHRCGIPQPVSRTFTDSASAVAWLDEIDFDTVVKADGLAGGKGVIIPETNAETIAAIRSMLDDDAFGVSGATIVLEERMYGEELSLFAVTDGTTVRPLVTAQDHKRVGEGDTGPNTGGMGAFAPVPGIDSAAQSELDEIFLNRAIAGMAAEGNRYVGVLFAGIMITDAGPRLVEYNCRFGDPEAEVILPLIESDGLELLHAAATQSLDQCKPVISTDVAATVVVAAEGYPDAPRRGIPVTLPSVPEQAMIHHGDTTRDAGGNLVSSGGRVLAVTGLGADLDRALTNAYGVVDQITGDGLFARGDIGWRHSHVRSSR